jgi:hypothetical protein
MKIDPVEAIAAIHEAGHAVMARVLDYPGGCASIIRLNDEVGIAVCASISEATRVWQRKGWKTRHGLTVDLARACIAAGGIAAEMEFLSGKNVDGHDSDFDVWKAFLPEDDEDFEHELWLWVRSVVSQYRDIILAVANALIHEKYLTGAQIDEFVEVMRSERGIGGSAVDALND